MLASLRRSRSTLLYQATPLLSPSSFAPSSSVRFLRTPRHTRSAAARARTLNGDGDGVSGSSFGQPREEEGSGLKRIRGLNPRELVANLDEYVVGQGRAKRVLAVAVFNHYTRLASLETPAQRQPSTFPTNLGQLANELSLPSNGWTAFDPTPEELKSARRNWEKNATAEDLANGDMFWGKNPDIEGDVKASDQTEPSSATIKPKPKSARGNGKTGKNAGDAVGDGQLVITERQWFKNEQSGQLICLGTGSVPYDPELHGDPTLYDSAPHSQDSLLMPFTNQDGSVVRPMAPMTKDSKEEKKERLKGKREEKRDDNKEPSPTPLDDGISFSISLSESLVGPPKTATPRSTGNLKDLFEQREAINKRFGGQPFSKASALRQKNEATFEKSNLLLIGPTGSGKSLLVKTLARALDVPFVSVEATSMTSAGYVGEDVESAVARLVEEAGGDVEKASRGIIFIDEIDKISASDRGSKDVGGTGVQQALLKMLEGTMVNVSDYNVVEGSNSRGLLGMIKKGPSRDQSVDTTNILFIVAGAFVGLEKIVQSRLTKGSIGFTSRIAPSPSGSPSLPRPTSSPINTSVSKAKSSETTSQQDLSHLLDEVEPSDLVSFGLIPEFIGRLPITASLKALTESDLLRILTEPKNALVKQYQELFNASGVELKFTTSALRSIAKKTVSKGTGARGLRRLMENVLLDPMFESPQSSIRYVLVTKSVAEGKEAAIYFSRAEKWRFDQVYSDEEATEKLAEPEQETIEEMESSDKEAEQREKEKHERVEKRRRKISV